MRTKKVKIGGEIYDFLLVGGISGLVKVYSFKSELWLFIGSQKFTVQDELKKIVIDFLNINYLPANERGKILAEFRKLCEVYK